MQKRHPTSEAEAETDDVSKKNEELLHERWPGQERCEVAREKADKMILINDLIEMFLKIKFKQTMP